MKNLRFLFLMVPVALMMSCNRPGGNDRSNNNERADSVAVSDNYGGSITASDNKEEDFAEDAAMGGMMEVELGRYVEQNASNPRVKNYASMMVRDHSKANEELKGILTSKNVNVPSALDDNHRNKLEDLQKKTGSELDKDYIKEMVDDHEKDVDKFKRYAENGEDPELKAFAAKTLPVLLMHLDSAKNIKENLDRNR